MTYVFRFTILFLVGVVAAPSANAAGRCEASKLKAVAKDASGKASCHSKAVAKGAGVAADCLAKAESKLSPSFDKAQTASCLTAGDAAAMSARVDAFVADLVATLGSGGPNACTAAKYKAAGKKASKKAACYVKALVKGVAVDPTCITKVEAKFTSAFAKADAKGTCLTGADADTVEARVDAFVAGVMAALDAPCAAAPAPFARARQIASTERRLTATGYEGDTIAGPLARGTIGDYLLENDEIKVVIQKPGRVMFGIGPYGGTIIDADRRRSCGDERDSFEELAPLINIENTANYTNVTVLNDGTNNQPAVIRATGPDDLLDYINPSSVVTGMGLPFPATADDQDLPIDVQTDYTLEAGKPYVRIDTTITNNDPGPNDLSIFFGDIINGSGQVELFTPSYAFGEPLITDVCPNSTFQPCAAGTCDICDFVAWSGYGLAAGVSYGYIHATNHSSNFNTVGVTVALLGHRIGLVLVGAETPGTKYSIPPNGGSITVTRYFAVGDGSVGDIASIRNDIRALSTTGTLTGTVTVDGAPVEDADVVVIGPPYSGPTSPTFNVVDHFHTRADGTYGGTLPAGTYTVRAQKDGHPYPTPASASVMITAGGTTTQDFAIPAAGQLAVTVIDENGAPVPAKVQVIGVDPSAPVLNKQTVLGLISATTSIFGEEVPEGDALTPGIAAIAFADKDGVTPTMTLEPGSYQVAVSHGPRYSLFTQNVTVTTGATTSVTAQIARVIDTPGFVSADFHVHAINSPDSAVTNEDRVTTQLAEGMDFFTPSDHDHRTDFAPAIAALGVGSLISTAPSAEITTFDYGHFNSWPVTIDPSQVNGGGVDWGRAGVAPGMDFPAYGSYSLTPAEIWTAAAADPKANLTQINHMASHFGRDGLMIDTAEAGTGPPQSHTPGASRRLDPGIVNYYSSLFEVLEVWIGTDGRSGEFSTFVDENLGDWVNLLNQGILPAGVADSDTHKRRTTKLTTRNYVASTVTDPGMLGPEAENLAANVVAGKVVGTNGPFVTATVSTVDGTAGLGIGESSLVGSSDGNATITVNIKSPLWAEFDKVQILVNAAPKPVDDDSNPATPNRYHALPNGVCSPASGCWEYTPTVTVVNDFPSIPGAQHREATVVHNITGLTQDSWVIVLVRGTDGVSRPLFPVDPQNILATACSNDPCKSCSADADCGSGNTCSVSNQTLAELTDGNLGQCGVMTLAFTNPLYIDADGVPGWQPPGIQLTP
jgi:hypothetical protein